MSRPPRIWFPGAAYHITNRGNRRSTVFYDDQDYLVYLKLLEEVRCLYPFHLHAYCLMTNHIHLLIKTIQHHPKDIMQKLNSRYAMYFNKRYQLEGHVFQGRYGAKLVDTMAYLLDASRYIHLNPLEASMVISPEAYPWSSYSAYVTNSRNFHIKTETILSFFPEPQKDYYRKFVEGATNLLGSDPHSAKV